MRARAARRRPAPGPSRTRASRSTASRRRSGGKRAHERVEQVVDTIFPRTYVHRTPCGTEVRPLFGDLVWAMRRFIDEEGGESYNTNFGRYKPGAMSETLPKPPLRCSSHSSRLGTNDRSAHSTSETTSHRSGVGRMRLRDLLRVAMRRTREGDDVDDDVASADAEQSSESEWSEARSCARDATPAAQVRARTALSVAVAPTKEKKDYSPFGRRPPRSTRDGCTQRVMLHPSSTAPYHHAARARARDARHTLRSGGTRSRPPRPIRRAGRGS